VKTITIESVDVLDEDIQTEVHYSFGMEHYTDYVFKPRGDKNYSATIVFEDSREVIRNVEANSVKFPDYEFVIEDLDTDTNLVREYRIKNGSILKIMSR